MSESDETYWFKPRRYGYGARPTHWKGWAVSFAYLFVILGLFFVAPSAQAPATNIAFWLCAVALVTLPFVWLSRVKTKGEWRWRWGERE